ncbi:MAG: hypothetical protein CR982_04720 [Candidatus Cloacimonadota bacterium]|nr:MAG: hypothetical protein CR982_04720 [Candidatus Cloacimonadota bacterium]PIE81751.1 MAG: hypothetical protein CSA15_00345 [Candidatus Delongbacteria bacterium]
MKKAILLDISRYRVPIVSRMKDMITNLASYGFNEIFFNIENSLEIKSFPFIGSEMDSYTQDEMRDIIDHAKGFGVEIVPIYQSCGHMFHSLKWDSLSYLSESESLWSVAPNIDSLDFFDKVYSEIATIFDSEYIHVGGDEVYDFMEGRSKDLYPNRDKYEVYLEYILKLRDILKSYGKKLMIWGDIIQNRPELIKRLPKDVIVLYWMYDFDEIPKVYSEIEGRFYISPGLQTWKSEFFRFSYMKKNLKLKSLECKTNNPMGFLLTDWGDGGHIHSPVVTEFLAKYALEYFMGNRINLSPKLKEIISLLDSIHNPDFMNSSLLLDKDEFLTRLLYFEYPISGEGYSTQSIGQLNRFLDISDSLENLDLSDFEEELRNYFTLVISRTEVIRAKIKIHLKFRQGERITDLYIADLIRVSRLSHLNLTKEWLSSSKPMGLFYHNHFHNELEKGISEDFKFYKEGKIKPRFFYDREGCYNLFSVGNRDALHALWERFV